MSDIQLSGNALAHIIVDKIFIEKDTTAAELMIIGIVDNLESGTGLSADQREYLKRALKALIDDPENPKQVYQYYMHLWKLFYLSYLVLPFAR